MNIFVEDIICGRYDENEIISKSKLLNSKNQYPRNLYTKYFYYQGVNIYDHFINSVFALRRFDILEEFVVGFCSVVKKQIVKKWDMKNNYNKKRQIKTSRKISIPYIYEEKNIIEGLEYLRIKGIKFFYLELIEQACSYGAYETLVYLNKMYGHNRYSKKIGISDHKNNFGYNLLHLVCTIYFCVEFFYNYENFVNNGISHKKTQYINILKYLVKECNFDINERTDCEDKQTVLHLVLERDGNEEIMNVLLELGANAFIKDKYKKTCLDRASKEDKEILEKWGFY